MTSISLVLSTYNGQKYIKEQLDSIRKQTVCPDEVIIRDDCSTDGTAEFVSNYIKINKLKKWSFTINKTNLGYKENFYSGVIDSKGDYIFLCDQDDEWYPNKIEKMMSVFMSHPEIMSLNCGVLLIDGAGNDIIFSCEKNWSNCNFLYTESELQKITFFSPDYILRHNIGPGCAMAIDRRLANIFIKTYNKKLPHDWHMNLIASINNGCVFFNEPLIRYRKHNLNTIGTNNSFEVGVLKKTNKVRIDDYESRLDSYNKICDVCIHQIDSNEKTAVLLINSMIAFYKKPNIQKLFKIRKIRGYNELAKRKVQFWEIFVALHLDVIIRKILCLIDLLKVRSN